MSTSAVTADGRARPLADGNQMPMLGRGVWQVPNGPECVNAVRWALELGYRHIDTAQAYGNEESVGLGLRESGVPREEVFITDQRLVDRGHPRRAAPARRSKRAGMTSYVSYSRLNERRSGSAREEQVGGPAGDGDRFQGVALVQPVGPSQSRTPRPSRTGISTMCR